MMSNGFTVSVLVLLAVLLVGCGAGLDAVHAGIATSGLETSIALEPVIRDARVAAMTAEVERVHAEGGTPEHARVASATIGRRWQCAVDGHRLFSTAVGSYIDALWLEQVGEAAFDVETMLPFVRRVLDAYRTISSCAGELGTDLPVPDFLNLLPPTWGLR